MRLSFGLISLTAGKNVQVLLTCVAVNQQNNLFAGEEYSSHVCMTTSSQSNRWFAKYQGEQTLPCAEAHLVLG